MKQGSVPVRVIRLTVFYLFAISAAAQNTGSAPIAALDASDIYAAFKLRVNDLPGTPAATAAAALQVGVRAHQLGITSQSPFDAWTGAQALLTRPVPELSPSTADVALFAGSTASALNAMLLNPAALYVRVTSAALTVDQPINLVREGLTLDLGTTQLSAATTQPYMIRIAGAHNVTVSGGIFTKGNSAILVSQSANVVVGNARISGLTGDGIVVTASSHVMISHNRISGLGGPGIVIHTGTTLSVVEQNDVTNGLGQSNWMAGIVVSDRDVDLAADPHNIFGPDGFGPVPEPIRSRLNPPRDNLIAFNHVALNASSGIYMDGGVRMTLYSNTILGNAKEGLCLDNGATANVVTSNTIQQNGKRWGQTDTTLLLDYVPVRLPDGTAAAKVPGISIDNAIYNVVYANNISHNFGGGVKMVRTAFFNIVGLNVIESDNDGVNALFRFFGIELGAAPGDSTAIDLDFTPSRGNIVFSNAIRGSNGSGIFIGGGSDSNEITGNIIMDARDWAIESAGQMQNDVRDNLTSLQSENSSGCCLRTRPVPQPR